MSLEAGSGYLDSEAIARGEALGVEAREVVEGLLSGEHRSPFRGFAVEFAQHREYSPGDDLRHLDWRVWGRTDRYYIKQYEQETNFVCHLLVDASGSMGFVSGGEGGAVSKLDYARRLAACVSYLVLRQGDAVSLRVWDQGVQGFIPRTGKIGAVGEIMRTLGAVSATGTGRLAQGIHEIAAQTPRRGMVVLVSDLLEEEAEVLQAVRHLRYRGHEVVVFQVMDRYELDLPLEGNVEFDGLEGEGLIATRPEEIRATYLEELQAFMDRVRVGLEQMNCDHVLVETEKPLAEVVGGWLVRRRR